MENKINMALLILIIFLNIFLVFQNYNSKKQEDLNYDGVVNSADLLYLRKYLIEMEEK